MERQNFLWILDSIHPYPVSNDDSIINLLIILCERDEKFVDVYLSIVSLHLSASNGESISRKQSNENPKGYMRIC